MSSRQMPRNGNEHDDPHGETPQLAVQIARTETKNNPTFATRFSTFAARTSQIVGSAWTFVLAIAVILGWAITGPMFHYSNTWQLIINTGTTIVTFLMVFLIQNTQNRDAKGIHLKLNELVHALKGADNELIDVEKLSDEELKKLDDYYNRVRAECERRNKQTRQKRSA
jgi:low affinity Fe/Cu permease